MCRSLLAVAFLLLLDSLLFSVLVSGDIYGDVSDGKNEPSQAAPCLPNITSNGVPLNVTISRVLSSPKILPCTDTISKALKAMFELGKTAQDMRGNTTASVKDLCPAFVNLTSTVFWSGYRKHPGPNFRAMICSKDTLTKKAVEDRDFCKFYQDHQSTSTTTLELLEEYPKVTRAFQELMSMGGDCEAKCGKGSKRVLCNAFFALARLLSMKDTIEQAKSSSTPNSAEKIDASTSNAGPLTPSLDRSNVIRHLATPILSLSRDTLDVLVLAAPSMLEFSLNKVEDVPADLRAELLQLEDSCVILRMFWIVKINPVRLRSLSDESWNMILNDPVLVFPMVVWFQKNEEKEVRSFQNLDQVVKYIYRYRKIILIDLPTLSTDKKLSDLAASNDETEKSHNDQEVDLDSANPPPNQDLLVLSNTNDVVGTGRYGKSDTTTKFSLDRAVGSEEIGDSQEDQDVYLHSTISPSNAREDGGFDNDEESERHWPQMEQGPKEFAQETKEVTGKEKAKAETPPKTETKSYQSGGDDDDEVTGRSHRPFHFLTLFLIVGAVVVVTYVCMHYRKKKQTGK